MWAQAQKQLLKPQSQRVLWMLKAGPECGACMGPCWKQRLCACGTMINGLRDRQIRVQKECSSAPDILFLTMGLSMTPARMPGAHRAVTGSAEQSNAL